MRDVRVFDLPTGSFRAEIEVPGDKSLSHRALLLAAMAEGESMIVGLGQGADVQSTLSALHSLGVESNGERLRSHGIGGWRTPPEPIDCGNSGSTMRMVTGAIAGSQISAVLIGDDSLMLRPMRRLVEPLATLGADVCVAAEGTPPVEVQGRALQGAAIRIPIASAQLRTAVALAALSASGDTTIHSPPGFRDHTERWLVSLGHGVRLDDETLLVHPGRLAPLDVAIPGDPSSAAFLWAAAAVRPGAIVTTPNVSLNSGRVGFLDVLQLMGADVSVTPTGSVLGDPIGTVTVVGRALVGIELGPPLTVRSLDELPLVAVLAAAAEGQTVVTGAGELRVKETDRIAASIELAMAAGGTATATDEGFVVSRGGTAQDTVDARGDHRIAMAGAIASLVRGEPLGVVGFGAADVSWPGFSEVLESLWS